MSLLMLVLSCRSASEVPPPPPPRTPPPCDNLSAELHPALSGQTDGLDVTEAGVEVVVEASADVVLPEGFTESLRAGGLIQGRMPAADLCVLASTAGVTEVRAPLKASTKPK